MIRACDKQQVGSYAEYPGAYAWPIYEYRCADCGKWVKEISDIARVNDDGSETAICELCAQRYGDGADLGL